MKKAVIILAIILLSISARADWGSNYQIKFTIGTGNGKICNGYSCVYRDFFNVDSLENTEYLKKEFYKRFSEGRKDTITYFQDRIEYEYKRQVWYEAEQKEIEQKDTIYYLVDQVDIPLRDIRTIRIDGVVEVSPFDGISSELQLGDTTWMKQEPVKRFDFNGYFCSYKIFIHVNSVRVNAVIGKLELKQEETDKKIELSYLSETAEESYKIMHEVEKIGEEVWEILKELDGEKVVVVFHCTD